MKRFYKATGLAEIYQQINKILDEDLPGTNMKGTKYIDHICRTRHVMQVVVKAKIINRKNIIYSDHKGMLVILNTEALLCKKIAYIAELGIEARI